MSESLISHLLARVDETLRTGPGGFPVYADPVSGRWHVADEPEWNGGFWPGLLWLAAAATGEARYAEAAAACLGPAVWLTNRAMGVDRPAVLYMTIVLSALVLLRHRTNIVRLLQGKEEGFKRRED